MPAVNRERVRVLYSGKVQGVGFRFNAKSVAREYEVIGIVRNLVDGRVELVAEGCRDELEAFLEGLRKSGLGFRVQSEDVTWQAAEGCYRGFEII